MARDGATMQSYSWLNFDGQDKAAEYTIRPSVLQAYIIIVLSVLSHLESWNVKKSKSPKEFTSLDYSQTQQ